MALKIAPKRPRVNGRHQGEARVVDDDRVIGVGAAVGAANGRNGNRPPIDDARRHLLDRCCGQRQVAPIARWGLSLAAGEGDGPDGALGGVAGVRPERADLGHLKGRVGQVRLGGGRHEHGHGRARPRGASVSRRRIAVGAHARAARQQEDSGRSSQQSRQPQPERSSGESHRHSLRPTSPPPAEVTPRRPDRCRWGRAAGPVRSPARTN